MSRASLLLAALLVVSGCKKSAGEACDEGSCESKLVCVEWTPAHEDTAGDCAGKRCCTTKKKHEAAERKAECEPLIGVVEAAHQPKTHTITVPRELEQLALVVTTLVPTFEALALTDPELARIRDEYVELSKELADAAKQRAFHVNRFDGPNVFKQIDRMKAVANREAALATKIAAKCKSGDRPRPAFWGRVTP